jgi:hypothetical protein
VALQLEGRRENVVLHAERLLRQHDLFGLLQTGEFVCNGKLVQLLFDHLSEGLVSVGLILADS